jgi:hypothetical protein
VRRLLREQDQVGAAPIALTISHDANTGAGQDPHRPDCGGSTPPSCRDRVASIAAMQRFLKPQSTGQHRGDPPFHAGVAQQRQQQFRKLPGDSPHGSASLPVGPISCSRSSNYQSGRLRTARLQVRFLPGVPSLEWNANRASEPGLFAKQCVPSGKWRKSTAFRHFLRA